MFVEVVCGEETADMLQNRLDAAVTREATGQFEQEVRGAERPWGSWTVVGERGVSVGRDNEERTSVAVEIAAADPVARAVSEFAELSRTDSFEEAETEVPAWQTVGRAVDDRIFRGPEAAPPGPGRWPHGPEEPHGLAGPSFGAL
ncbi:hypothetical protein [Pseudonocardia parietis]|uniref:YCII-related domain-containing protein n=1 Tax=Pseudonocardia parietis TaxID=570936 RepID=A0ABS4VRW5_9PSEU|nr:hypothetical protein [Pseudonocardia parietis]MBP2366667.1 hypothetical protein [Pseudonocardia parietis]